MRYLITLCYDGTGYCGWQVQPGGRSVQGELQRALSLLTGKPTAVTGAGRTDAGVSATMMTAHFDGDALDTDLLAMRLNRLLPTTIAVRSVAVVADDFHARFSARRRTYHYYIHTRKDPFLESHSLQIGYQMDFHAMNLAAASLPDYHDFAAFCKSHSGAKTTLCTVFSAQWRPLTPYSWQFEICADRFLRNMVRAIVGTLIDVGRGRLSVDDFRAIVEGGRRTAAGQSVAAKGLFLEKIEY